MIIAGFLVVAARGGKSGDKRRSLGGQAPATEIVSNGTPDFDRAGPSEPAGDVVALLQHTDQGPSSPSSAAGPSVVVMPFEAPSDGASSQREADELHDDIVTMLSKSSDIAVIGRKARAWTGTASQSIRSLGRELDARYAVIGDFSAHNGRSSFAIHLLETSTGSSIWSKHFDLEGLAKADSGFLINQVAGSVAAEILRADAERTLRQGSERLNAESLINRATQSMTAFNRRTFHEIESLARMAIELKPNYPTAFGVLAGAYAQKAHQSWTQSSDDDLEEAFLEGVRTIELSPSNPRSLYWWGYVHLYGGRTEDAIGILEQAIASDTSFVPAHIALGAAQVLDGRPAEGGDRLRHALHLGPDHAQAFNAHLWLGVGYLEMDDAASAQTTFLASINHNVIKNPVESGAAFWAWIGEAASYASLGKRLEAKAILTRLRERFVGHDFGIMFDRAEASFAPNLQQLNIAKIIAALDEPGLEPDLAIAKTPPLRGLFGRRIPLESEGD